MFRACVGLILSVALILSANGCSGEPEGPTKAPVQGKVTLDGAALPEGEISFVIPGQVPNVIPIANGEYAGEASVGDNRVEIRVYQEVTTNTEMYGEMTTRENTLPDKYNNQSTLAAQVTDDGPNEFSFEVTSK